MIQVDIDDIQIKLCEKFKPCDWYNILKAFILSEDFERIIKTLVTESNQNKKFTPPLKQVFRAFEECNYKDLKVIFLSQDVYPQLGISDGIAFSCSNTMKEQPSLRFIFDAIQNMYQIEDYNRNPDLKRWSNQGVLLINCGMTCQINNVGSHIKIWKPFITYLIDQLNYTNSGLIYVLMGDTAQQYEELINDNLHYVIKVEHPNKAYYNQTKLWKHDNVFKQIDEILLKNNNQKIQW